MSRARSLGVLAGALVLAALVAAAGPADGAAVAASAKPRPLPLQETCLARAERRRVIRFRAADGVRLVGVVLGAGTRGVVLGHQGRSDLCIWMPYARRLARAGFRVLAIDFRGYGSSEPYPRAGSRVDRDAVAAVRELRRRGARSVVVAGGSLGGSAAVLAGALVTPPVNAVVSLSAPARYEGMDVAAAAARSRVPALFVAAAGDSYFPDDARTLYAAAAGEKRLEIVPGEEHGVHVLQQPAVWTLFRSFVSEHSPR